MKGSLSRGMEVVDGLERVCGNKQKISIIFQKVSLPISPFFTWDGYLLLTLFPLSLREDIPQEIVSRLEEIIRNPRTLMRELPRFPEICKFALLLKL